MTLDCYGGLPLLAALHYCRLLLWPLPAAPCRSPQLCDLTASFLHLPRAQEKDELPNEHLLEHVRGTRIKVRRQQLLEDGYVQMGNLSADALKGTIRVEVCALDELERGPNASHLNAASTCGLCGFKPTPWTSSNAAPNV